MTLRTASLFALLALFSTLFAAPAAAQLTYNEPPDLSNSVATATPLTLAPGTNTVSGTVATPSDRQDNFTITIPAGAMLTGAVLTLDTRSGFVGSVTFNLSEVRTTSGAFTMGFPFGPGTYYVQVITDFAVGNAWSMRFTVSGGPMPVCGNGTTEGTEACDDGNTTPCDGCSATCTADVNGCNIGGSCIAEGTLDPSNACRACRRAISRTMYSPVMAGTTCNDGQFCTTADACDATGTCTGAVRDCADTLACTTDACDEATDACTNTLGTGCLIGGACVAEGAADPTNACTVCIAATSTSAYSPAAAGTSCDDGLFCTSGDVCDGAGACAGPGDTCDDGDPCTIGTCDEGSAGCDYELAPGCVDAGPRDAGPADGGPVEGDAGPEADAGPAADAGPSDGDAGPSDTDAGPSGFDAGMTGGGGDDDGGCGCRVADRSSTSTGLVFLGLALALVLRRRRRD